MNEPVQHAELVRDHEWRPWRAGAWKPEPFKGACGECTRPKDEHEKGRTDAQ